MSRAQRSVVFLVGLLSAACGGGGGGDGADAGPEPVDAGIDTVPMATGNTASGALAGAQALATGEFADAVLYSIDGHSIGVTGEVDVENNQSYWTFTFISVSESMAVDVLWDVGLYTKSVRPYAEAAEARLIATEWQDSDAIIAKLIDNGYEVPPEGDPEYQVTMTLRMWVGPPDEILAIPDPFWKISKIHNPPGQTATGEEWSIWYVNEMSMYLLCPPDSDECTFVE